jgi:hypothetical protein
MQEHPRLEWFLPPFPQNAMQSFIKKRMQKFKEFQSIESKSKKGSLNQSHFLVFPNPPLFSLSKKKGKKNPK